MHSDVVYTLNFVLLNDASVSFSVSFPVCFYVFALQVSSLFYYCMYSAFSGSMPLDSIVFGGYNFYLGMPIVVLGAFDFDVPRVRFVLLPYHLHIIDLFFLYS